MGEQIMVDPQVVEQKLQELERLYLAHYEGLERIKKLEQELRSLVKGAGRTFSGRFVTVSYIAPKHYWVVDEGALKFEAERDPSLQRFLHTEVVVDTEAVLREAEKDPNLSRFLVEQERPGSARVSLARKKLKEFLETAKLLQQGTGKEG